MIIKKLSEIKKILFENVNNYSKIALLTHKNPDGDGLPACLALQEILSQQKIKSDIILEEEPSEIYDFLAGFERVKVFSEYMIYDLLIFLDCHEEERIGICEPLIPTAKKIIAIDHHLLNEPIDNADTYIDVSAVSAGAIIFNMFKAEIEKFKEGSANYIAKAIYTSIINDTDNFLNQNVDENTFLICSQLMKYKINPGRITELFLLNKPANEIRFVGEVLSTIETYDNDQILFMHADNSMLRRNKISHEGNSKLTSWVKGTQNVKVAVLYHQVVKNRYRLSLRSNYINVNKIAVKYGGGGHEKASGCEMKGSLEELKNTILKDIREQL
ncbi:MAG: bifunctional oligoribonuclease/PAP phosphatase NrnA [Candidatus Tenebribacter davisii]|jgi:phosphoesterase RecJ-like protein|nr:bifunctional oligoribonuclease/PAP phosphatase NrnA [Candidatus Tenebribacter davisii]